MTVKYGPWIAFNPGDTPPADDVVVQVQLYDDRRSDIEMDEHRNASNKWNWGHGVPNPVIAYRVVKQTMRGEVVVTGSLDETGGIFSDVQTGNETNRLTMPTVDGELIPGIYIGPDGATIKIEAL